MDIKQEPIDNEYGTEGQLAKEFLYELPIKSLEAQGVSDLSDFGNELHPSNIKTEFLESDVEVKREASEDDEAQSYSAVKEEEMEESFTSTGLKSDEDVQLGDETVEVSQRMVYDASFEKLDVGCSLANQDSANQAISMDPEETHPEEDDQGQQDCKRDSPGDNGGCRHAEGSSKQNRNNAVESPFESIPPSPVDMSGSRISLKKPDTEDKHSLYKIHKLSHSGEKPYSCTFCEFKTAHSTSLKNHTMLHTGEKRFMCDECIFRCSRASELKKHKMSHTGEKPFKCDLCSYCSVQASLLKLHKMTHTGDKPFKCDKCSYKSAQSADLVAHKTTHTGEKPFHCDQCTLKYTRAASLKTHKLSHSDDLPFKCNECTFQCIRAGSLNEHKMSHSGQQPFKCDQCSYKSTYHANLQKHKRIHSDEKPFKCDLCDYECVRGSSLKTHVMSHTGEKPFRCGQCDFKFVHSLSLKKHLKFSHNL